MTVALLHALEHHGYPGQVAVTALHEHYRSYGTDLILRPFAVAADATCELLDMAMRREDGDEVPRAPS